MLASEHLVSWRASIDASADGARLEGCGPRRRRQHDEERGNSGITAEHLCALHMHESRGVVWSVHMQHMLSARSRALCEDGQNVSRLRHRPSVHGVDDRDRPRKQVRGCSRACCWCWNWNTAHRPVPARVPVLPPSTKTVLAFDPRQSYRSKRETAAPSTSLMLGGAAMKLAKPCRLVLEQPGA